MLFHVYFANQASALLQAFVRQSRVRGYDTTDDEGCLRYDPSDMGFHNVDDVFDDNDGPDRIRRGPLRGRDRPQQEIPAEHYDPEPRHNLTSQSIELELCCCQDCAVRGQRYSNRILSRTHRNATSERWWIRDLAIHFMRLVISYAGEYVDHFPGTAAAKGSTSEGTAGPSSSDSRTTQSKRKSDALERGRGSANDGDEDEEDNSPDRPSKTLRHDDDGSKRLACPFFKHAPRQWVSSRSCTGPGFHTAHRVKYIIRSLAPGAD